MSDFMKNKKMQLNIVDALKIDDDYPSEKDVRRVNYKERKKKR